MLLRNLEKYEASPWCHVIWCHCRTCAAILYFERGADRKEGRKQNKITVFCVIWSVMSVKWLNQTRRQCWGVIGGGKSEKAAPVSRYFRRTSHPLHHYRVCSQRKESDLLLNTTTTTQTHHESRIVSIWRLDVCCGWQCLYS